jgi:hypothetical protein
MDKSAGSTDFMHMNRTDASVAADRALKG